MESKKQDQFNIEEIIEKKRKELFDSVTTSYNQGKIPETINKMYVLLSFLEKQGKETNREEKELLKEFESFSKNLVKNGWFHYHNNRIKEAKALCDALKKLINTEQRNPTKREQFFIDNFYSKL